MSVNDVPVKEVRECEYCVGVGAGEEEEEVEAVSWAWELLCFSPSLPVNWKSAGGFPSESTQAQSSLLREDTQTQDVLCEDNHPKLYDQYYNTQKKNLMTI